MGLEDFAEPEVMYSGLSSRTPNFRVGVLGDIFKDSAPVLENPRGLRGAGGGDFGDVLRDSTSVYTELLAYIHVAYIPFHLN